LALKECVLLGRVLILKMVIKMR